MSLAATFHGILKMDEWIYRTTAKDKMSFAAVRIGQNIKENYVNIGVQVFNSATFPIEFHVADIRTKLTDTVPKLNHTGKSFIVPPNGTGWYDDNMIALVAPKAATLEGEIEFTLKYGRPGNLKYKLTGKKRVIAPFNDEGVLVNGHWNDVTE